MRVIGTLYVIFIVGCAAGQKEEDPFAAQRVLVRAGFQFKTAETAEELAELKALPQKRLFQHPREGRLWYVYADQQGCNCLYYGDEDNYKRLQQMISDEKAAARRGYILQMDQRSSVEHGMAPQINWERWEN